MKLISTLLATGLLVVSLGGCINVSAPEKVEVNADSGETKSQKIPYGGSKQDWANFGKSFK